MIAGYIFMVLLFLMAGSIIVYGLALINRKRDVLVFLGIVLFWPIASVVAFVVVTCTMIVQSWKKWRRLPW